MTEGTDPTAMLDRLAALPPPSPRPLGAAFEAELGTLAAVSVRRPQRQLAMLAVVSLVYAAGLLALLTVRADARELPTAWIVGVGVAWLCAFAIPLYFAIVPRAGAVIPRWGWAAGSMIVTSLAFVALGLAIHPSGEHSAYRGWERFASGYGCLALGVATALVPVVLGTLCLRRSLPVGGRWIAAALGAGGGCLGGLLLHFHCPIADGPHIGLMHGGVVVVAAGLSAVLAPRATTPK